MTLPRWWPALRTTSLAIVFTVTAIGMAQWAFTGRDGFCIAIPAPYKRLCAWFCEKGRVPVSDYLDHYELRRLAWFAVSLAVVGALLILSILAQRPFRFRLSLRALMLTVAILPIGLLAGQETWVMWSRWGCYQRTIHELAESEEWSLRENPSDTPEVIAIRHENAATSQRMRLKLQRRVWSPGFWLALASRVPYE